MLALKITDVKDFMNKLLIGEVFDRFSLVEAAVTTFTTFTIRGRRTPLNFRIVFELSHDQTQSLLKNEQHIADIPVQSFYLNIRYKNQSLLCTTGVSYTSFSPDKRLEHLWDDSMTVFLSSHHIPCEKL